MLRAISQSHPAHLLPPDSPALSSSRGECFDILGLTLQGQYCDPFQVARCICGCNGCEYTSKYIYPLWTLLNITVRRSASASGAEDDRENAHQFTRYRQQLPGLVIQGPPSMLTTHHPPSTSPSNPPDSSLTRESSSCTIRTQCWHSSFARVLYPSWWYWECW
jgi:hypothetical protein